MTKYRLIELIEPKNRSNNHKSVIFDDANSL